MKHLPFQHCFVILLVTPLIGQVWLLEAPDWKCEIDEGSSGLVDVQWSPDSRHILSTDSLHLRITVWSLINKTTSYIQHPKNCSKYIDFTRLEIFVNILFYHFLALTQNSV